MQRSEIRAQSIGPRDRSRIARSLSSGGALRRSVGSIQAASFAITESSSRGRRPPRHPGINPALARSRSHNPITGRWRFVMSDHDHNEGGVSRLRVLECMTWAGTGVLWTISGGVPRSIGLVGSAQAAEAAGMTFLQISDSHIGFDKPANPNAKGTLEEAIEKIRAMPAKPSFMIHTGDITHLSKVREFDDADRIISQAKLDVHYV